MLTLYESGKSSPNDEIKKKICDYFDVTLDYLVGFSDNKPIPKRQIIPRGYDNSISHWILKTGLGYGEVAQKLGISEDLLMDYVEENIPIPYQILIALSEICEVSTDCLLGLKSKSREKDLNNVLPFRYDYRIAKRIRKLCQESNVDTKSSFLENLLCLSSKEVFYLIEYGFIPHMDTLIKLPDMPGGMPSLRRTCLPAQTMHESSQFTVSFIPFSCYTIHEDISTLQSTAW